MHPKLFFTGNRNFSVLLVLAVWLSGCASGLSKEECDTVDWRTIGYEDGIQGSSQTRVSEHRKACARHGVALDLAAYRQGWQDGVAIYCQPASGYRQGRGGRSYQGVCPQRLEAPFLQAYRDGRALYALDADVRRLGRTLAARRARLTELETAIRDTGLDLVAPGVSTEQRIILLDELRKLEAEHSELRNYTIPELEHELAARQDNLARLRAEQQY